jgi:diguanylate cyclase (GGDEF)-like protein/PAS domain S-box-containing protein
VTRVHRIKSVRIRTIVLAMALTMAASALFQIDSYRKAKRVGEINKRDAHVRDVLAAIASLRSAVQEAVIGQRGYLLTGGSQDLELYRSAADRVTGLLGQVGDLTANDPAQAEYARRLRPLIVRELEDLEDGVDVPRERGRGAAGGAGARAEADARSTDEIRRVMDGMTDEAQQVRSRCLAETQAVAAAQARSLVVAAAYRVGVLLSGCTLILLQQARQRRTEQQCRQSEELFRNAFDHAATGMALADETGRWLRVNRALCDLVGYAEGELLRRDCRSITHAEDHGAERDATEALTAGRVDSYQLEKRYLHKDGRVVPAVLTKSLVRDEGGRPQTFISQIQDITERKRAEDRLRHQSLHDALTGLPNRLLLGERIQRGIDRARQDPDYRLAVLFLDLDRFKLINDSLGHAAGDKLLTTVAERLGRCVRGGDGVGTGQGEGGGGGHVVARLAGDEFTVLLEGLRGPGDAEVVAERILWELAKPVEFGGQEIRTSASIGIVHHGDGRRYETARELLADADAALYKAKAAGRGGFAVFDADMQQSALARLRLAGELRRAVEHGQFVLHYQPIVSLEDRQVAGFEALVRWEHPERGLLGPEDFIDVAEETGLIVPLGNWVLQEACRQLAHWRRQYRQRRPLQSQPTVTGGADLFVTVALSRKQLVEPGLVRLVRDLKEQRPGAFDEGGLRVKIGEPVLMQDLELVNGTLKELRSAGVRVWVGNFGAGITSLGCLRSTGLDGLKIDRRAVGSAADHRDSAAVVHSVLELARNLGLQVVAEGLETAEQVAMLQAMGCDLGQGFYFAPPLAAGEAEQQLNAGLRAALARPA